MKDIHARFSIALFVSFFAVACVWQVSHHTRFSYFFVTPEVAVHEETIQQSLPEKPHGISALKVPIFVYHSVRPYIQGESQEQDAYDITPELFEKQLIYLQANGYTTITPDQLAHSFAMGTTSPVEKPVMLTFDDGWENQYKYAYPLLKKYHMTAVFYVYTRPIGFKHFLTWDQLQEMRQAGMILGSHTITHPYFAKINDLQLRDEIIGSKSLLEEKLGVPVTAFASPFGYSDDHIVSLIREAGYITGRTIYKGVYHTDMLSLKGILVSDNMNDFVTMLGRK